jgi:non-ribosomal peptide synthase protein (TIGR01720 family)/FkbM family methyltransferase
VQWLYEEIFERHVYARHGITFVADACVFDVGAHIGMFTLFVSQQCPQGRIYAFEPIPETFRRLERNVQQCSATVMLMPIGLGQLAQEREFVYYEKLSVMTRQREYDRQGLAQQRIKQQLRNEAAMSRVGARELLDDIDELLEQRSATRHETAMLRRLSDVMREENIERIDLLKIDVEGAELDVLRGIDEKDWPCIDQIVMEVEDAIGGVGPLRQVQTLLMNHGYDVIADADDVQADTGLYHVYGWRSTRRKVSSRAATRIPHYVHKPQELRRELQTLLPDYLVPAAVVVLKEFPRTPSGKLDRRGLPVPDVTEQQALYRPPRSRTEEIVCGLVAEVLGLQRVGLDDNFFALGGDSIVSIQLVGRVRKAGFVLTPRDVFQHPTIEELAAAATVMEVPAKVPIESGVGVIPLTPILGWLQERGGPVARFCQSAVMQVPAGANAEQLMAALEAVIDHHDALRLRLTESADGIWGMEVNGPGRPRAKGWFRRLVMGPEATQARRLRAAARQAAGRLAPTRGVMVQAVWFDAGAVARGQLLLVVHHLAVDGVSWRILLPDLQVAWEAVVAGRTPGLGTRGTSFRRWAELLATDAQRPARVQEMDYWDAVLREAAPLVAGALDPVRDRVGTAGRWRVTLPSTVTEALLTRVAVVFHAGINDVLLAGLVVAVALWRRQHGRNSDQTAVLIDVEGHGREEVFDGVNLSQTVGWFTSIYPVRLDPGALDMDEARVGGPALGQVVKIVKEQLRRVPDHGLGYGLLRFLNPKTGATLARRATPQLGFNYLGRFAVATPSPPDWSLLAQGGGLGGDADAEMPLAHAIEVNAVTLDGADGPQLTAHWRWAQALVPQEAVQQLAKDWFQVLASLVQHSATSTAGGRTPSDLPLVTLTQAEIDELEESF